MNILRKFVLLLVICLLTFSSLAAFGRKSKGKDSYLVYVGTYTHSLPHVQGQARGIHVYRLDAASGALTFAHTCEGIANPSYLTLDPRRRYLYSVAERAEGQVHAFRIDPATGALTPLNHQSSQGSEPAHISVHRAALVRATSLSTRQENMCWSQTTMAAA